MSVKPAQGSVPTVIVSVEGAHDIVIVRLDVVEVLGDGGVGMMSHRDAGGCRDGLFLQFRTAILEPDLHLSAAQLEVTWEVGAVSCRPYGGWVFSSSSRGLELGSGES